MGGAASSPQPSPDVIAKVLSLSPLGRDLGEDVCLDVAPLFRRVKALQGQSIYAKKELRTNLFVVEEGGLAMITGVFALPTQDTARRASLTFGGRASGKSLISTSKLGDAVGLCRYARGDLIGVTALVSEKSDVGTSATADEQSNTDLLLKSTDIVASEPNTTLLTLSQADYERVLEQPGASHLALKNALDHLTVNYGVKWCRKVSFFVPLNDDELKLLVHTGTYVSLAPAESVSTVDRDGSQQVYVVLAGELELKNLSKEGRGNSMVDYRKQHSEPKAEASAKVGRRFTAIVGNSVEAGMLGPGDFVGEMTLLDALMASEEQCPNEAMNRGFDVTARSRAQLLKFSVSKFASTLELIDTGFKIAHEEQNCVRPKILEVMKARSIARTIDVFNLAIFQGLDADGLQVLHSCSKLVNFRKGEAIFCKGDPGDFFYVVCQGRVNFTDPDQPDLEVFEECVKGEYFGEMALTRNEEPRKLTATAAESTICMQTPGAKFQELFLQDVVVRSEFELRSLERQVSLAAVLAHPDSCAALRRFLEAENADENLAFWLAVEEYRGLEDSDPMKWRRADEIFAEFVITTAPHCVNISAKCRQAVEKSFADKEVSGAVFDRAQKAIELLIKRDNFPRFLKSGSFTEFLIALGAFGVKKQSAATGAKS